MDHLHRTKHRSWYCWVPERTCFVVSKMIIDSLQTTPYQSPGVNCLSRKTLGSQTDGVETVSTSVEDRCNVHTSEA